MEELVQYVDIPVKIHLRIKILKKKSSHKIHSDEDRQIKNGYYYKMKVHVIAIDSKTSYIQTLIYLSVNISCAYTIFSVHPTYLTKWNISFIFQFLVCCL